MVIGLQWAVEFADPDFPAFYRHDDDITKWGGPNVDNTYLRARVRGVYRHGNPESPISTYGHMVVSASGVPGAG